MSKHANHAGHGHGHMDSNGSGHHNSAFQSDKSAAAGVTQIGLPFTPMVHTAPILSMMTPHQILACPQCTSTTLWSPGLEVPPCAWCGAPLSP